MAQRLKVFTWADGFHAFTVAATSRPKALQAWGVTSDLFQTGLAQEAPDNLDAAAALASPGSVIKRGIAVDVGQPPKRKPASKTAQARKAQQRVTDLEARLVVMNAAHVASIGQLEARQQALDDERSLAESDHLREREAIDQSLEQARSDLV